MRDHLFRTIEIAKWLKKPNTVNQRTKEKTAGTKQQGTADKGTKEQGNRSSIRVHKTKKGMARDTQPFPLLLATSADPHATTLWNSSLCSTCSAPPPPETGGSFGCRRRVAANNNRSCCQLQPTPRGTSHALRPAALFLLTFSINKNFSKKRSFIRDSYSPFC